MNSSSTRAVGRPVVVAKQRERQPGSPHNLGCHHHPKIFPAGCYRAEIAEIPPPGVSWSAARSQCAPTVAARELGSGAKKGRLD